MANEEDDDEKWIKDQYRTATPFPDGNGLRGPNPRLTPLREIQGATGGAGSYQTEPEPSQDSTTNAVAGIAPSTSGSTIDLTVIVNGTSQVWRFQATQIS